MLGSSGMGRGRCCHRLGLELMASSLEKSVGGNLFVCKPQIELTFGVVSSNRTSVAFISFKRGRNGVVFKANTGLAGSSKRTKYVSITQGNAHSNWYFP